jgi:hypothetical protein
MRYRKGIIGRTHNINKFWYLDNWRLAIDNYIRTRTCLNSNTNSGTPQSQGCNSKIYIEPELGVHRWRNIREQATSGPEKRES